MKQRCSAQQAALRVAQQRSAGARARERARASVESHAIITQQAWISETSHINESK
jgi:hypothetical protein